MTESSPVKLQRWAALLALANLIALCLPVLALNDTSALLVLFGVPVPRHLVYNAMVLAIFGIGLARLVVWQRRRRLGCSELTASLGALKLPLVGLWLAIGPVLLFLSLAWGGSQLARFDSPTSPGCAIVVERKSEWNDAFVEVYAATSRTVLATPQGRFFTSHYRIDDGGIRVDWSASGREAQVSEVPDPQSWRSSVDDPVQASCG